jgi:hypothetical protein
VQLAEEVLVERHHPRVVVGIGARRRVARDCGVDPKLCITTDRIDAIQVGPGIETGVLDPRDHQCGNGKVRVGAEGREGKVPDQLFFDHLTVPITG